MAELKRAARHPKKVPGWQYELAGKQVQIEQTWAERERQYGDD